MLATSTHAALANQYLDRLAFGWQRRSQALDSHVLDAAGLSKIDRDLRTYARGMESIGPASSTLVQERLLEPLTRGELFAIAHYAIGIQDQPMHKTCIGLVRSVPTLRGAYAAALEWSTSAGAWWAISEWQQQMEIHIDKRAGLFDALALSACRNHPAILQELCTTSWWSGIIESGDDDSDGADTMCALMQLGLATGHPQAADKAVQMLRSPVAQIRCHAAEVILWAPPQHLAKYDGGMTEQKATDVLVELATGPLEVKGIVRQASRALASRRYPGFDTILSSLEAQTEQRDLYLQCIGWRGNCQLVPILIAHLEHPEHGRGAGAALSMLTGSLPARDGWQAEPAVSTKALADDLVNTSATIPPAKHYATLPPPDRAGFERWWAKNKARFNAQSTWLAGLPDTDNNLISILQNGKLAWRTLAARRLHARLRGGASPDTSAPMLQQRQWISNYIASPTLRNAA